LHAELSLTEHPHPAAQVWDLLIKEHAAADGGAGMLSSVLGKLHHAYTKGAMRCEVPLAVCSDACCMQPAGDMKLACHGAVAPALATREAEQEAAEQFLLDVLEAEPARKRRRGG
jgi:hypothetical protein